MATSEQLSRLRRMIDEPTDETYLNTDLEGYIDRADDDLHAAAAVIWDEKAATVAGDFDFTADGGTLVRSQRARQYTQMAEHHRKLQRPRRGKMHQIDDDDLEADEWYWTGDTN